jgi:glycosyltransferase involved in cell wall biosynthesis
VKSALAQKLASLEVLVVDDGSRDRTAEAACAAADGDPRLQVIRQPNGGTPRARNTAMAVARGRYFALLDSDDEWQPDYLTAQVELLDRHRDVHVVTANVWNRGGAWNGTSYWPLRSGTRTLTLLDLISDEASVCVAAVFRREVYETIGGFDESLSRGSEDYDFWIRASLAGFAFLQNFEPLAYYQRRAESLSASELNMVSSIMTVLEKARSAPGCPAEARAAIDGQLRRFEGERLWIEARAALRRRDFGDAADRFAALHTARGGMKFAVLAALSRRLPSSLLLADRVRRVLRSV